MIFLSLQLKGVALTRNCTFWVVREKNESEQDFKRAWDYFRAVNSNKVRFCEDVSLHSKPNDCWLMIKDKVHGDHDPLSNHLQFSMSRLLTCLISHVS